MSDTRNNITDWVNGIDPVTDLGYVVDDLHDERRNVFSPYLGLLEDDNLNTVVRTYAGSPLETDVESTVEILRLGTNTSVQDLRDDIAEIKEW